MPSSPYDTFEINGHCLKMPDHPMFLCMIGFKGLRRVGLKMMYIYIFIMPFVPRAIYNDEHNERDDDLNNMRKK
jgi:hypothetical protein